MTDLITVRGDITDFDGDAIVNAANSGLRGGGGVDGAIHAAGGPEIMAACVSLIDRQGPCAPGDAVITTAGQLSCRNVIHAVGPIWTADHADHHDATLAAAYHASLGLAAANGLSTIAFPNISTGVYGFPKPRAAGVAIAACRSWLKNPNSEGHDGNAQLIEQIHFFCFDEENEALYQAILG